MVRWVDHADQYCPLRTFSASINFLGTISGPKKFKYKRTSYEWSERLKSLGSRIKFDIKCWNLASNNNKHIRCADTESIAISSTVR